ncbi:NAD(P)H-dependent flavin oxidoreductase [Rhodopila sp.]|uniref:NAD(P)H-dependent flavin oxidoreductase n=1 Tax=Rhodopila sp. TaxID=2480087 RepID=UPI002BB607CD|nr:nitronate monooxygenase [Rhodopila sp.]HVZ07169.1 nitronate monooxygenase [Rhodopila sp.]
MPRIETALTRLLGIEHPILTAPMTGAVGGALANAVSQSGAMGLIAPGQDEAVIRRELQAAGNARIGIGFVTWQLARNPAALDIALQARPEAIMLSFGDASPYIPRIKAAGTKLICQVQSLAMARDAASAGADIIVAQGREAGGHGGAMRGTLALVPAVVDAVSPIPVVAAGGIADGRGLAAVLSLGAAGVSVGTRFVATRESLWPEARKAALIAAGADQTVQSRLYDTLNDRGWPHEFPARFIRNETAERWAGREAELEADPDMERAEYARLPLDDVQRRLVLGGEGLDLVTDLPSARDVVERIVAEAAAALRRSAGLLRD